MNSYKKTIIAFTLGLLAASSVYSQVVQLDNEGKKIGLELIKVYMDFVKTTKKPPVQNLKNKTATLPIEFNFEQWDALINIYVKTYVEDNSKSLGIKDGDLMRSLSLLLQTNSKLMTAIKQVQTYEKPIRPLNDVDFHFLIKYLLYPLEQIEQNIKSTIIPALEKQSYWVSTENKNKAKAMLVHTFDLMRHIADDTMKSAAALMYTDINEQ